MFSYGKLLLGIKWKLNWNEETFTDPNMFLDLLFLLAKPTSGSGQLWIELGKSRITKDEKTDFQCVMSDAGVAGNFTERK